MEAGWGGAVHGARTGRGGGRSLPRRSPLRPAAAAVSRRRAGGRSLRSLRQHPGPAMAGVGFAAHRLELLASYQDVIGEDSPTDW